MFRKCKSSNTMNLICHVILTNEMIFDTTKWYTISPFFPFSSFFAFIRFSYAFPTQSACSRVFYHSLFSTYAHNNQISEKKKRKPKRWELEITDDVDDKRWRKINLDNNTSPSWFKTERYKNITLGVQIQKLNYLFQYLLYQIL